jgi:hypothetical protein
MSQKTFIEQRAKIGDVTIIQDWSMGKYGVSANCVDEDGISTWTTDIYEFEDKSTAESVFNLLVSVVVELNPEIQAAQFKLISEEEQ